MADKTYFIIGEKICLRGLERSDLEGRYLDWINDPEVTTFMTAGLFPQTMEKLERYFSSISNDQYGVYFAIVDKSNGKHIGNAKLENIDWINRRCEFGILVGEKSYWGKGVATEATALAVEYAFTKLNLRKVQLEVVEDNIAAVKCYEKVGFKKEGLLREMNHFRGKYLNVICMGILKSELKK